MSKFERFVSLDHTKRKKIIFDALSKSKPVLWIDLNMFGIVDQFYLVMYLLTQERDIKIDELLTEKNKNGIGYGLQIIKRRTTR